MAKHGRHAYRSTLALAVATTLLGSLAACGNDDSNLPPPASPPPASGDSAGSLDPEDAEAAAEILSAFDNYMEGLIELSTAGVPGGTEETEARLEEIQVGGEAYLELAFDLLTPNAMAGHATAGTITWEAEVVEIDWDHTYEASPEVVPMATLKVCFDETDWTTVDAATGDVVDGPGERYQSTVLVTWRDEDRDRPDRAPRWQVAFREDGTEPC